MMEAEGKCGENEAAKGWSARATADFSSFAAPYEFKEVVNFVGWIFPSHAYFNKATFSGGAEFIKAAFSGRAGFTGAAFSGNTLFTGATFAGETDFSKATFSGLARFEGTTFSGLARFADATFSDDAGFTGVWGRALRRGDVLEPRAVPGRDVLGQRGIRTRHF